MKEKKSWRQKIVSYLMLLSLTVPLATVAVQTVSVDSTAVVYAKDHGDSDSSSNKNSDDSSTSSSDESSSSDSSSSSQGNSKNVLDDPATDLGKQAATDLLATEDKKDDSSKKDGKDKAAQDVTIEDLAKAPNQIGNAWSFMGPSNTEFWSTSNQGALSIDVSKKGSGGAGDKNIGRYKAGVPRKAYMSMVNASHLPFFMASTGLDRSYMQGFPGQNITFVERTIALFELGAYSVNNIASKAFSWIFQMLDRYNPWYLVDPLRGPFFDTFADHAPDTPVNGDKHFGLLSSYMWKITAASKTVGGTFAAIALTIGITLAVMGIQVGQSAKTSVGRGIVGAGIDAFKRFFVILCLSWVIGMAYTQTLHMTRTLFEQPKNSVANFAVYSTMSSFEDMVGDMRLALPQTTLSNFKNTDGPLRERTLQRTVLTHKDTLLLNQKIHEIGAGEIKSQDQYTDKDIQSLMSTSRNQADINEENSNAISMLSDFIHAKQYRASDYVSAITEGLPGKDSDSGKGDSNSTTSSQQTTKDEDAAKSNLKSATYAMNGGMVSNGGSLSISGVNSTGDNNKGITVTAARLAQNTGGLSTIGMYNYLRTAMGSDGGGSTTMLIGDPTGQSNTVSNPIHYSSNFVGTGVQEYGNMFFALGLMSSVAIITLLTITFVGKAFIDSIPGTLSGVIQGSLGSLAGGAKMMGTFVAFLITIVVTGFMFQVAQFALFGFISSMDDIFNVLTDHVSSTIAPTGLTSLSPNALGLFASMSSAGYGGFSILEGLAMIYIALMMMKWRGKIILGLTAAANVGFTRIMQSAGSLTGKGSYGMQNTVMNELAAKSQNSGLGQLRDGIKNGMSVGGRFMQGLTHGSNRGIGKYANQMAKGAIAGGGAYMGLKALEGAKNAGVFGNQGKNAKKGDQKNAQDKPQNSEDAQNEQDIHDLASRQNKDALSSWDPDTKANTAAGDNKKQMKDQNEAAKASQHVASDAGRTNDKGAINEVGKDNKPSENSQADKPTKFYNPKTDTGFVHSKQGALDQILAQASDPNYGRSQSKSQSGSQHKSSGNDALKKVGNDKINQTAAQAAKAGQKHGIHVQRTAVGNGGVYNPAADVVGGTSVEQVGTSGYDDGQVVNTAMDSAQFNPNDITTNPGSSSSTSNASGTTQMVNTAMDSAQFNPNDITTNQGSLSSTSNTSGTTQMVNGAQQAVNVAGQPQQVSFNKEQSQGVANAINDLSGADVPASDIQKMSSGVVSGMSSAANSMINFVDQPDVGAQTITATGNGQATVTSSGSIPTASAGLNASEAYGMGTGVMPGSVPIGMSVDPGYTSSGAGVIHGGLNTALGNVQNAKVQVTQAQNAVAANPGNQILQQRATQALQAQQQAQVEAMRTFNSTPAVQTVGSLMNSNAPRSVSAGQVNQAVSDVYNKQQAFKHAVLTNGSDSTQAQQAAVDYQQARATARQYHIKQTILDKPQYLKQAYKTVRSQQQSIIDGSFKV